MTAKVESRGFGRVRGYMCTCKYLAGMIGWECGKEWDIEVRSQDISEEKWGDGVVRLDEITRTLLFT